MSIGESGTIIDCKGVSAKANFSIFLMVLGRDTFCNLLNSKALELIEVTELGIDISCRPHS